MSKKLFVIIAVALLAFTSCKKKKAQKPHGSYISIIKYTQDQWQTYHGQAFPMQKIVTLNGKTDSSYLTALDVDWGAIFKTFFESDISDPKYIGEYDFSVFDDNTTYIRKVLYYQAKNSKLFTRSMEIDVDPTTNKIISIFIQTDKNTQWMERSQKLYYAPLKIIQIQEQEKSTTGPIKNLKIEYKFL